LALLCRTTIALAAPASGAETAQVQGLPSGAIDHSASSTPARERVAATDGAVSPPTETEMTEVIEPEAASAPSPAARSASAADDAAAPAYRFSGWAYQGFGSLFDWQQDSPAYLAVPRDVAFSHTQAQLRFSYALGRKFEAVASGSLLYSWTYSPNDTERQTVAQHGAHGAYEMRLQELYAGVFWTGLDLRIGQQRVAWGRAEALAPNDVLNARDLRDPFPTERNLFHQPTPLVRADVALGDKSSLQLIFAPIFVPDKIDIYGSNWALIQPGAPDSLRGFFHQMGSLVDASLLNEFNRLTQQSALPPSGVTQFAAGTRAATTLSGIDLATYYYYGYDRTPRLKVDPAFAQLLQSVDFSMIRAGDFAPLFNAIQAGQAPIALTYERNHHLGADFGTTLGPLGLTFDLAYDTNRGFFLRDLTGYGARTGELVAALEYQTGDIHKVLVLESSVLHLFEQAPPPLLFVQQTTATFALLARAPLLSSLDVELRARFSPTPNNVVARLMLEWRVNDRFALRAYGTWTAGDQWGLGGYFEHNSGAELGAKVNL